MAKTVIIDGYEFVTNNFAAILDKPSAPEAFHAVQDFLRSSSIGYALVQPESISPTAVIAIWSTVEVVEEVIKFKYADKEYVITSEVVRQALRQYLEDSMTGCQDLFKLSVSICCQYLLSGYGVTTGRQHLMKISI